MRLAWIVFLMSFFVFIWHRPRKSEDGNPVVWAGTMRRQSYLGYWLLRLAMWLDGV